MIVELPTEPSAPVLVHGDCLDVLPELPDECVDAIVDDPPAGIGFMGRAWDDHRGYAPRTERGRATLDALRVLGLAAWEAGFVAFMFEAASAQLRVCKPGAHRLTWALPRTADLTVLALRLAGWEIRDSLVHLFGGGFPKSLDVSKALDKMAGAEREVVGVAVYGDGHVQRSTKSMGYRRADPDADHRSVTAPATDAARRWQGWGTALSPGHEQWVLARKPLAGTVAANVIAHGTGAINVDGCRTPTGAEGNPTTDRRAAARKTGRAPGLERSESDGLMERRGDGSTYLQDKPGEALGRWPKNALLSCSLACERSRHTPWCPVGELDRQGGELACGKLEPHHRIRASENAAMSGPNTERVPSQSFGDSGKASRYFPRFVYQAKADDRRAGLLDVTNKHPTHKSPELMRWLVRLITPPGGLVLDSFAGSGTTGVACIHEGARFLGIERDPEHFAVARSRLAAAVGSPEVAAETNATAQEGSQLKLL